MYNYIVCMNTCDLQIQCNIYTFFKQISFHRFKILYISTNDRCIYSSDRRAINMHVHVAYRYILVRAQITLANCKMFVFLVFDHLIKNKKTNIVRTSPYSCLAVLNNNATLYNQFHCTMKLTGIRSITNLLSCCFVFCCHLSFLCISLMFS